MASTRRPSYRTPNRAPGTPAEPGAASGATPGAASGRPEGPDNGIISASRPAGVDGAGNAAGSFAGSPAGRRTTAGPAPGRSPGAPPEAGPDNVLSFPEPPARRRKRIILGAAALFAVLMAGITLAAVYSPVLALRTVMVDGTRILGTEQVQAALAPLQGRPLPQISDEEVADLLKPLVQVKAVSTQARPPSALHIRITERVPVALVKQGATFQLVDAEGVQLSTTTDPASIALPVIDGGGGTLPKDLFEAITSVLGALPGDVLAKLSDAKAKSVDAVELRLVDGQTILWGNAGEKELKARVLAALLKVSPDPTNPVRTYDVSVPRHPVTR